MPWNLDSSRPIYLQIIERVQMDIITGRYQPGDKLPSVRDLAQEAAVNPNTMQKALSELERSGLIYSQRTSGRFITEDKELIHQMKKELAAAYAFRFVVDNHVKILAVKQLLLKCGFNFHRVYLRRPDLLHLLVKLNELSNQLASQH